MLSMGLNKSVGAVLLHFEPEVGFAAVFDAVGIEVLLFFADTFVSQLLLRY